MMRQLHRTKQELVYQRLRDGIMSGEFAPGQRLIIDEISRQLGVSHIPVREALQTLHSERLVVTVPHMGVTVAPISTDLVIEVFSLMEGLEFVTMPIAAERFDVETRTSLRQHLATMDGAMLANDPEQWARLNSEFHQAIARATGMAMLEDMTARTFAQWERVRRHYNVVAYRMETAQAEHHEIVAALERGDADSVRQLAIQHNRGAKGSYLAQIEASAAVTADHQAS